jgi:hypothetical protein
MYLFKIISINDSILSEYPGFQVLFEKHPSLLKKKKKPKKALLQRLCDDCFSRSKKIWAKVNHTACYIFFSNQPTWVEQRKQFQAMTATWKNQAQGLHIFCFL